MTSNYVWKNIAITGGGYHQTVIPHPTVANTCATKCDIAGFYLWQENKKDWKLVGDFDFADRNNWGTSAFAWHPTDPDTFWIYCGTYFYTRAKLFKSTDGGKTLTELTNFPDIDGGGNQNRRRSAGERLIVAPDNPDILLLGTFSSPRNPQTDVGFFRSTDGGVNWTAQSIATITGQTIPSVNQGHGQTAVTFDRTVAGLCYLAVFGVGICRSTDYGATWQFIGGQKYPYKMVAHDNILYVAGIYQDDLPPITSDTLQGLSKYQNGNWTSLMTGGVYPSFNYGIEITFVDVNPFDTNELVAGDYRYEYFWRSFDAGVTWIPTYLDPYLPGAPYYDGQVKPYTKGITDVKFDPITPNKVWLADTFGVNIATEWDDKPVTVGYYKNLENTLPLQMIHPPGGKLTMSMYDLDCLQFTYLNQPPLTKIGGNVPFTNGSPRYSCSSGLDYSDTDPQLFIRSGINEYDPAISIHKLAKSTDGGITWQEMWNSPTKVEKIKISSTDSNFLVVLRNDLPGQYSLDGGNSWSNITGLTSPCTPDFYLANPGHPLDKDRTNGNVFYCLDDVGNSPTRRNVFKIVRDGATVTASIVNSSLPSGTERNSLLKTNSLGEVWVSLYDQGLWKSTDGGVTFNKITAIQRSQVFCFGPSTSSTPRLYVCGIVDGTYGIYVSEDGGTTFTIMSDNPLNDKGLQLTATCMESHPETIGLVYLGTDGHGAYYSSILEEVSTKSIKLKL